MPPLPLATTPGTPQAGLPPAPSSPNTGASGLPPVDGGQAWSAVPQTSGLPSQPDPAYAYLPPPTGSYPAVDPGGYPVPTTGNYPYPATPVGYPGPPTGGYPTPGLPGYQMPVVPGQFNAAGMPYRNGMGTAAMVLGIIGLCLCWVYVVGTILGVLAVIFGGVGIARANRGQASNKGQAVAGLVLGILAVVFWIVVFVAIAGTIASL